MKILITGGTGSFGSAMVEKLLKDTEAEIVVFSRDEYKQFLMHEKFKSARIQYVIGDIRDEKALKRVCASGIDCIFHAAAMKHVRICDENPVEAVQTNIIGTTNVIEAAIKNKVKKIVILSTDKAVCPQNTMGLTKALAEKIALHYAHKSDTKIMITRFGNLIMSKGCVLEKFIKLAKNKQSLTVTSPKMERFMMTTEDAVDLVLFALNSEKSGHIFVKKSKVFNIMDIAESVNQLCHNIAPIKFIAPVSGEKEVEELLSNEYVTDCGDFYEIDPSCQTGILTTVSSDKYQKESIENIKKYIERYI